MKFVRPKGQYIKSEHNRRLSKLEGYRKDLHRCRIKSNEYNNILLRSNYFERMDSFDPYTELSQLYVKYKNVERYSKFLERKIKRVERQV